jgi:arabinogalactan endo-1,4-beta-galactosidase
LSCSNSITIESNTLNSSTDFIRGADLSALPQVEVSKNTFYNLDNQQQDFLTILKNAGLNTVRLKLWKNPATNNASLSEVKTFANKLKAMDLKVWLDIHYSDTWADPGNQKIPLQWQGLTFNALKDSVYNYTKKVVSEINPDFVQIGNEINNGFLFPLGKLSSNESQFISLISTAIKAVRDTHSDTKIILHYAGYNGALSFFNKFKNTDYDIIGLSYYPKWHGNNLQTLSLTLNNLGATFNKEVLIAETSYPFTLGWNDYTNNIISSENQILPEYPASPNGQRDFILKIKNIVKTSHKGIGFCYWGGELIAFNGPKATNGSAWENQALFDFNNKALPVIEVFKSD